jgi:hypothetical protein
MFNSSIQPDPIFSVFHCFQYQNNSRLLFGLQRIVCALAHCLSPVIAKVKFKRMGIGYTIAADLTGANQLLTKSVFSSAQNEPNDQNDLNGNNLP